MWVFDSIRAGFYALMRQQNVSNVISILTNSLEDARETVNGFFLFGFGRIFRVFHLKKFWKLLELLELNHTKPLESPTKIV